MPDPIKRQKMFPKLVTLPKCRYCGANRVAVEMNACLKCGKKQPRKK